MIEGNCAIGGVIAATVSERDQRNWNVSEKRKK